MADTKKEHYVPRCYLENFEDNNGRIHVFDKVIIQTRNPKKEEIAHENYFYDMDIEKLISDVPLEQREKIINDIKEITGCDDWDTIVTEIINPKHIEKKFFCEVEGVYGPLLKRIIQNSYSGNQWVIDHCAPFSEDDKSMLSLFLAIQIIRTKAFRDSIHQISEKTFQTLLYKQQLNDEVSISREDINVKANSEYIKLLHLDMILDEDMALEMAEVFSNHIWVMNVNKTSTPFYTSDNPVLTIPHIKDKYMTYGGYNSKGVEVVFPVSPNLLLSMYEKRQFSSYFNDRSFRIIKDDTTVDYYNRVQVAQSFRCVFSNMNEFSIAKDMCDKYPEIRDPNNRITVC